jgi:hypothetical protein
MDIKDALSQIDVALELAEEALDASETTFRSSGQYTEAITVCASTIERLTTANSVYAQHTKRVLNTAHMGNPFYVEGLLGTLKGLRRDIEAGYLRTLEEEVHAGVFADLLEMADQL